MLVWCQSFLAVFQLLPHLFGHSVDEVGGWFITCLVEEDHGRTFFGLFLWGREGVSARSALVGDVLFQPLFGREEQLFCLLFEVRFRFLLFATRGALRVSRLLRVAGPVVSPVRGEAPVSDPLRTVIDAVMYCLVQWWGRPPDVLLGDDQVSPSATILADADANLPSQVGRGHFV